MRFRQASLLLTVFATTAFAEPSLFYSKTFPGSVPAYAEITLAPNGEGMYKEDPADEQPVKFQLSAAEAKSIFDLAAKLDYFSKPLESGMKVAKTGDKKFRWTDGAKRSEQTFNYSVVPEAQELATWFERITETERAFLELERTARFERLGVNQSLLAIQALMEKKRLVAAGQFLEMLDRVNKNAGFINMARERAKEMAEAIRVGAAKP